MYSQRDFSTELGQLLDDLPEVTDHARIADWAYKTYLRNVGDIDPDVKQLLVKLGTMSMGPEFEHRGRVAVTCRIEPLMSASDPKQTLGRAKKKGARYEALQDGHVGPNSNCRG